MAKKAEAGRRIRKGSALYWKKRIPVKYASVEPRSVAWIALKTVSEKDTAGTDTPRPGWFLGQCGAITAHARSESQNTSDLAHLGRPAAGTEADECH